MTVFTLACGSSQAPPADAWTSGSPTRPSAALVASMGDHAAHGRAMRDAVARADLDRARTEASALAQARFDYREAPSWQAKVDAMVSATGRVSSAKDLAEASHGVAAVARSCGDCHATFARERNVVVTEPPPPSLDLLPRMQRHQWAEARLWSGLAIPSSEAWTAGARVLRDAPLEPERLTAGAPSVQRMGELARAVHDLGDKSGAAETADAREAAYGQLLGTCSECHALLSVRPNSP